MWGKGALGEEGSVKQRVQRGNGERKKNEERGKRRKRRRKKKRRGSREAEERKQSQHRSKARAVFCTRNPSMFSIFFPNLP